VKQNEKETKFIKDVSQKLKKIGNESILAVAGPIKSIDNNDCIIEELKEQVDKERKAKEELQQKSENRNKYLRRIQNNHQKAFALIPEKCNDLREVLERQAGIIARLVEYN
jgi:hypothetical protein